MTHISTRQNGKTHEPAYLDPPPMRRGDMATWRPGQHRQPSVLARIITALSVPPAKEPTDCPLCTGLNLSCPDGCDFDRPNNLEEPTDV